MRIKNDVIPEPCVFSVLVIYPMAGVPDVEGILCIDNKCGSRYLYFRIFIARMDFNE